MNSKNFQVALTLLVLLFQTPAARAERAFVFVHGAWVGEWYWDPVVENLRSDGHIAQAVTLTGHGKAANLNGPEVALEDHIQDVVAAIRNLNRDDIILVAHSYGGRPATGAWDRLRGSVAQLVFIEAHAPYMSGEVAIPADTRSMAYLLTNYPEIADSGMLPVTERVKAKYAGRGLAPQSLKTLYAELRLQNGDLPDTPAIYVLGTESPGGIFHQIAARMKSMRGWKVVEIDSGHDVVKDATDTLVQLLTEIAQQ